MSSVKAQSKGEEVDPTDTETDTETETETDTQIHTPSFSISCIALSG